MVDPCFELIPLSDPERWRAALEGVPHGPAHTWGHCRAFSFSSEQEPFLVSFKQGSDRAVCALSERTFRGEPDVFTPYGYGGFSSTGPIEGFASLWRSFARRQSWVCAYLQRNSLLCDPLSADEPGTSSNDLYIVDLSPSDDELFAQMPRRRRRWLRNTAADLFEFGHGDADAVAFLIRQSPDFFAARSASSVYRFSDRTFQALLEAPCIHFITARMAGRIEAIMVLGIAGGIADALIHVFSPVGREASAALMWESIRQSKQLGCRFFNMGGGNSRGDDLAAFKRSFGACPVPFVSLRQVFRPDVFERLSRAAGSPGGPAYFPPYQSTERVDVHAVD
jgi:hypothetical protein